MKANLIMETYKILIVDDMIENISIISSALEQATDNYNLYQALNAHNAFNTALKRKPNLIITDWDMPSMSGIQLIKKLKKEKLTKDIPVIMATGVNLSSHDLETALEAGAIDYIRKPIDKIELTARVRSVLELDRYKKQLIKKKNKELAENTLFLVRNNSFNLKIKEKLQKLFINLKSNKLLISNIISEIDEKIQTDSWYRFELAFESSHGGFKKILLNKFPKLTTGEIKLCTLVKLELSNKDIAVAMCQTNESIRVARTRLRKKLKLPSGENLQSFIVSL